MIEDGARRAGLGIWRDPDFAVIPSSDSAELRRRNRRLVVVEGKVGRVGFARSRLYLELVPHGGPTIVVARKLEPALARMGRPVGALVGETIRARGALDDRFGPRIEVGEPAMIEIERRADASGEAEPDR
jgi:micrococcal nuclease